MKKSALLLALSLGLVAGGFTACSDSDNQSNDNQGQEGRDIQVQVKKSKLSRAESNIAKAQLDEFVKGQYDLNFDLIRKSADQIEDKNAMVSTFSIQMALAMTWAGANGETASEMASALHFDENTHAALNKLDMLIRSKNKPEYSKDLGGGMVERMDAVEIKTTNDLYFSSEKYSWSDAWLDVLAVNYDAGLKEISFAADPEAARKYINDEISANTHDRIKDLLPENSITPNTRSVITNAIYFKAPWRDEIHKADGKLSFHKLSGGDVDVDYLSATASFGYMADQENLYQAVSLPLRDNDFSVMFILPGEGKFNEVQDALNGEMISNIFANLSSFADVHLDFPSYSFETSLQLKAPLMTMGMAKAFSEDADFSKMTNEPNQLFISNIYHKTFVGLDERGVEAAAATAVLMADKATPMEPVKVKLDRPYFFVIYESGQEAPTNTPLFVGRVMDPSAK
jgi:serpin B